jgi:Domain of unknown function (DUF4352)
MLSSRAIVICAACAWIAGCRNPNTARVDYNMGEKVPIGPLTYTVVDSSWKTQLGDVLKQRLPEQRFLLLEISVTNGGGSEHSVPFLQIENTNGQTYMESQNGDGVDNWLGVLRTLAPGETQQGQILFDVPLTSYRLRVPDGNGPDLEKYAWIAIPLRLELEPPPQVPGQPPQGVPVK